MQSSVGAAADARTGRPATRQQALEEGARVVHLVQLTLSLNVSEEESMAGLLQVFLLLQLRGRCRRSSLLL